MIISYHDSIAITAIIGEGDDGYPGCEMSRVAAKYQIPIILTGFQPDIHTTDYIMPTAQNTSFLMFGPLVRTFREVVNSYLEKGARTVVAVANERYGMYNSHSCFEAADLLEAKGAKILGKFLITYEDDRSRVVDLVNIFKILNPDVILWCDWSACASTNDIEEFFSIPVFKAANYLPKGLTMLDCIDVFSPEASDFQFVSGPTVVNNKIKGFDYTEDAAMYSSLFRPITPLPLTGLDQLQVGQTASMPSSSTLFARWYFNETGSQPSYYTVAVWAAFDVLEKVLWTASSDLDQGKAVNSYDVYVLLTVVNCRTPFGLIGFDVNGINTVTPSIFIQNQPSDLAAQIVGPSGLSTAPFIYPMPSWEDRVYRWTLIGKRNQTISIIIAAVCSFVLLAIVITVIVHRKDVEIRMFNYLHISYFCSAAAIFCWNLVFLWQADSNAFQCNSYLWVTYMTSSFFISMISMKVSRCICIYL
jgi:hypothetical protein